MDKELIEHITAQLQNHEETYPNGAWERFAEKENKKRRIAYWPLWAVAALILVFGGVLLTLNNLSPKNEIAISKPKVAPKVTKGGNTDTHIEFTPTDSNTAPLNNLAGNGRSNAAQDVKSLPVQQRALAPLQDYTFAHTTEELDPINNNTLDNKLGGISIASYSPKHFDILTEKKKPVSVKINSFEDLLARDSRENRQKATSKTNEVSKWQPDVYVAPSMGNDNKVTMNYGFSLSYAIANKLSISSGVSYASISTTESLNASAPQTLSGKNLESVDAKVRGINIPLELKYNISDKLYTNIGVSALAVLNNSQQNNYLVNQVQSFSSPEVNGYADSKTLILREKTSEPQPEATIDPDKYIGFYNFSLGYKQKISKKNNIAIEPFLRLPMKTFSKENLNLTNGGLRLKIDF